MAAQFGPRIVFTTDEASISDAQRVLVILTEGVLDHAGPMLLEVKLPHARMESPLTCAGAGVEDGQSCSRRQATPTSTYPPTPHDAPTLWLGCSLYSVTKRAGASGVPHRGRQTHLCRSFRPAWVRLSSLTSLHAGRAE